MSRMGEELLEQPDRDLEECALAHWQQQLKLGGYELWLDEINEFMNQQEKAHEIQRTAAE